MGIFKKIKDKLFGKKETDKSVGDIVVNTGIAFHKSELHRLEAIKDKIKPISFESLKFEDDLRDYTLELLSPEAKERIIKIIKEDHINRLNERNESIKPINYNNE